MKKKLLCYLTLIGVLIVGYYLLPWIAGGGSIFTLLVISPAITFVCALICGILRGFNFVMPISTAVLFAPSVFIFYNSSACIYILIYTVISLAGSGIGAIFYRKK